MNSKLDTVDHFAISVQDISQALAWYRERFQCEVLYQDDTWALLQFSNVKLALVIPSQHPPHLGFFTSKAKDFGPLKTHRDGTRSAYIADPDGNALELMETS